jgi:hypothetical protein
LIRGASRAEVIAFLIEREGLKLDRAKQIYVLAMRSIEEQWERIEAPQLRAQLLALSLQQARAAQEAGDAAGAAAHVANVASLARLSV